MYFSNHRLVAVFSCLCVCGFAVICHAEGLQPDKVLDTLRPGHPRLILTDDRLAELKKLAETDATLRGYIEGRRGEADRVLGLPPLERKLIGPRLLNVSRDCVDRVYALAMAWRFFGDEKYAKGAEASLLAVCAFKDWNPPHFLDTAEMSHGVGVGYDWMYAWLSEESRTKILTALIDKGLEPGIDIYEKGGGWPESDFNWNQVCNGGMIVGALAIAEANPDYARYIVTKAVHSLPKALVSYDPDGAWMEGPSYWGYATRYTAYGLCALDTALGTDFGLSDRPGLRLAGYFPIYTTGPNKLYLNYADSGERASRRALPCMFWLAQKYHDTALSDVEHLAAADRGPEAEHVIWYMPPTGQPAKRDLDRYFRGKVEVVVMRSAWDDPNALFVGVKAGYNQVNHGHLDLGNFEMDALGVRWVRDLGSDDYNLPGYWDKKPGGKRWQYYRLNTASHSVPMIDGENQAQDAVANVEEFQSHAHRASARINLTKAYPAARKAEREISLIEDRRAVRVRDEFRLIKACAFKWALTTDADIEIHDDGTATLTLNGRKLIARIESPKHTNFTTESAERPAPEHENKGVTRLLVELPNAEGNTTVDVTLSPVWETAPADSGTKRP